MAARDRDMTAPLPAGLADNTASTVPRPALQAANRSDRIARISPRPAVGLGTVLRERYVLEQELGRGGMGTVYRALDRNKEDLAPPHRYVAVKVLREEFARRPEVLQALRREAQQAQSLSHPGIVKVFDFDCDGGVYFITMELLEGELLSDLIRRIWPGKLRREAAIDILRDLGDAVAYAHSRGVLHMDLKPGNVMVTTQGDVRVLDFGLAHPHVTEPWISDHPAPFHAATPAYASCEQLEGAAPDIRDDVFSFACMAYELLCGEHPFGRSSAREARDHGQRPRRIRGLSRGAWRALRQGLAWARGDRPRNLVDFLEGLGLATKPRRVPSRHGLDRVPARPARSRWRLTIVGLCIVAVGVSATWIRLADDRDRGNEPRAMRDDIADPSPRAGPPQATAPALSATAADAESRDDALVHPLVSGEAPVLPDFTAAIALTPAPSMRVAPGGPGRLGFAEDTITVSESAGVVPLRVVRRGGAAGTVSFDWRAIDDSAVADWDYAALGTGTESLGPGVTSKTFVIPIVSDAIAEPTELFDIVIEDTTAGVTLDAITRITVIIVDDD